jgi:hypothetical protein
MVMMMMMMMMMIFWHFKIAGSETAGKHILNDPLVTIELCRKCSYDTKAKQLLCQIVKILPSEENKTPRRHVQEDSTLHILQELQ